MEKFNKQIFFSMAAASLTSIMVGSVFLLPNKVLASELDSSKLIQLSNAERIKAGLNVLQSNQQLTQAAKNKGQDILKYQKFAHTLNGRRFSAWVADSGYDYSFVGENLAIDFTENEDIIQAWLDSPLHRQNLLNPAYQEIGLSVIDGDFLGEKTKIVVQIFGEPSKSITPIVLGQSEFKGQNNFNRTNQISDNRSWLTDSQNSYLKNNTENWPTINEDNLDSTLNSSQMKIKFPTLALGGLFGYLLSLISLTLILDTYHFAFTRLQLTRSSLNLKIRHL